MEIATVTDADFEASVINSAKPVVVDFWAEWCAPCKPMIAALEELAPEFEGQVTMAKLNIDENPGVPQKYGVRGAPTLLMFHGGQVAAVKVGAQPKSAISSWIKSSL